MNNFIAKFFALLVMILSCSVATAIEHHSNSDSEKEVARLWLEKNQDIPSELPLMKALLSLHYQPSSTLLPFFDDEPEIRKRRIILSLMIFQCSGNSQLSYCEGKSLEKELVKLNPNNLFPYLLQFNHYVAKGEFDSALKSLKKGLTGTEVNDYYIDKVMYLRRELESIGVYGKGANLLAEDFGGNGLDKIYIKIMPTCTEHSKTSTEWATVCLKLSNKLELGTTFLANVVGAALRRDVLKAISASEEKINAAVANRKFYSTFRENARVRFPGWDDPAQKPNSYYNNAAEFGEFRAIQIMLEEVGVAPSK
jgi:tetratricopeptide (TPR) repeat protein